MDDDENSLYRFGQSVGDELRHINHTLKEICRELRQRPKRSFGFIVAVGPNGKVSIMANTLISGWSVPLTAVFTDGAGVVRPLAPGNVPVWGPVGNPPAPATAPATTPSTTP